jgi:hypothetical protein
MTEVKKEIGLRGGWAQVVGRDELLDVMIIPLVIVLVLSFALWIRTVGVVVERGPGSMSRGS